MPGTTVSPEAHYKLLSGAIHSQRGSESLGDIYGCRPIMSGASGERQSVIAPGRRKERGRSKAPAGHLEIAFVSQILRCIAVTASG